MYWIIELLGTGRRVYVESYSNKHGGPRTTFNPGMAKPFTTKEEAQGWAKDYLPSYKHQIVQDDN